jgi:hypothetical protein
MAKRPKGPKAHPTKWMLVFSTKVMRFDTLIGAEAELEKAMDRGERAYILSAADKWATAMKWERLRIPGEGR